MDEACQRDIEPRENISVTMVMIVKMVEMDMMVLMVRMVETA